jgi:tRNA(Ile)-lysidine synthase
MGHSSVKSSGLKHRFLRHWRENLSESRSILVAVSGGIDSVVLLDLLREWQPMLGYRLTVAHVHHGKIPGRQGAYRRRAAEFVAGMAHAGGLDFLTNVEEPRRKLKGEAELRDFRRACLAEWAAGSGMRIATAHSADDVLETQLIRMIRGTGAQGLEALPVADGEWIRPLIFASKSEIIAWAKSRKLKWVQDPSNSSSDPLRNWVRNVWLPALEKRDQAAPKNLARSLAHIVNALRSQNESMAEILTDQGVDRRRLSELPLVERRRALALYLRRSGCSGYTQGHVDEILKRLGTPRSDLRFTLLGREWRVSRDWLIAL